MKLNEARYRSPEWLRNFVDFEVNTVDDIKGGPSKRKAANLRKKNKILLKKRFMCYMKEYGVETLYRLQLQ